MPNADRLSGTSMLNRLQRPNTQLLYDYWSWVLSAENGDSEIPYNSNYYFTGWLYYWGWLCAITTGHYTFPRNWSRHVSSVGRAGWLALHTGAEVSLERIIDFNYTWRTGMYFRFNGFPGTMWASQLFGVDILTSSLLLSSTADQIRQIIERYGAFE